MAAEARRFRLEELRRFATALIAALGVSPPRAAALATHLLWFDAAGASELGIASLPSLLERLKSGEIIPTAEGRILSERSSIVVLDGAAGVPLLALARAAELAGEKARDVGIGLVRILNISPVISASSVAAGLAVGPFAALVFGPGEVLSVALPGAGGPPVVVDRALGSKGGRGRVDQTNPISVDGLKLLGTLLAGEGGWVVLAVSVAAVEPVDAFHARVLAAVEALGEGEGRLMPAALDASRRAVDVSGVSVTASSWKGLRDWAKTLGLDTPKPV